MILAESEKLHQIILNSVSHELRTPITTISFSAMGLMDDTLFKNEELRKVYLDYISKLKAVNFSDPEMSKKIGEILKVDAFLIVNVDYWNYTKEEDDNVGKVVIEIKMIDANTGKILWKAVHYVADKYTLFKPKLSEVAKSLVKKMIGEMPH